MTPAEHIFQWARNDQLLCRHLRAAVSYPDRANFTTARASLAIDAVRSSLSQMRRGGEDVNEYSAIDVLKTAILVLEWDGES